MGVRESSGALSYTLGDGKYAGFHVEICNNVLRDIQKQLNQDRKAQGSISKEEMEKIKAH